MAAAPQTSSDYISHHLTNLTFGQFPEGHEHAGHWGFAHNAQEAADFGFWAINVDSMFFSIALGALFLWGFRKAARSATTRIACPQKETSRGVSLPSIPTADLNHCRLPSIRLISAIGMSNAREVMHVYRSKRSSRGVSRIPRLRSVATLLASFPGNLASCKTVSRYRSWPFIRQNRQGVICLAVSARAPLHEVFIHVLPVNTASAGKSLGKCEKSDSNAGSQRSRAARINVNTIS